MGVPSHRCTHTQGAAAGTPLFETIAENDDRSPGIHCKTSAAPTAAWLSWPEVRRAGRSFLHVSSI